MEFVQKSLTDLFLHFPGPLGIFDSGSGHLVWENDNWVAKYDPPDRNVLQTVVTIAERFIHKDDRPTFLDSYQKIFREGINCISFIMRFVDHGVDPIWFLCTFKRFGKTELGRDLICCHQSDLFQIAESDHVRDFYHDFRKHHPMSSIKSLTLRELEVLKLIAQGLSYKDIAERLFIQPETVNKHRKNIQKKLHLNCIALLTCFAMENGLV